MQVEFRQLWGYTMSHYTAGACEAGCPCCFLTDEKPKGDDEEEDHDAGVFADVAQELASLREEKQAPGPRFQSKQSSGRLYLDTNFPPHKKLLAAMAIVIKYVEEHIDEFVHGFNTCFGESMHNKRLKFADKRKAYKKFKVGINHAPHTHALDEVFGL